MDSNVVLIGAGLESVFKDALDSFESVIRVGLAISDRLNAYCDVCQLPFREDSVDLLLSASVLEHVYDPERALSEMNRVLKPGGIVYAEIPFMRAYHMAPIDYQRYTISGIKEIFERNGFNTIEVGVCSGAFTAMSLLMSDMVRVCIPGGHHLFKKLAHASVCRTLHPLKYLDRIVEDTAWAKTFACNFFYVGRKP